jgi:hypothetical protein
MFLTDEKSNYDGVFYELLQWFLRQGRKDSSDVVFFRERCAVRNDAVYRDGLRLDSIAGILILRYLIASGTAPLMGEWVPYRVFKDGALFAAHIKTHIEDVLAREFSGKKPLLADRLKALGSRPHHVASNPDVSAVLEPFPAVPVLCLFWDRDEEFPASFHFLFDASAPDYLDLESLAVLLHYTYLKLTRKV